MLLQCAKMYDRTDHSNTKYHTKYNIFGLGSFRDTLCRFVKVIYDLATQLINSYHWFTHPKVCMQCTYTVHEP